MKCHFYLISKEMITLKPILDHGDYPVQHNGNFQDKILNTNTCLGAVAQFTASD